MGVPIPLVHLTVPKTATTLWSVPEGNGIPTSWHTIASGEVAIYQAHKEVRLLPGFHAEAGSIFIARIEPCWGCENNHKSMLSASINEEINEINETNEFNNFNDTASPKSNLQEGIQRKDKEINLYPNPNTGTFTISTNIDPQEIITIKVFNPLGIAVYQQAGMLNNTVQLPLSAKGLFWVEIQTTTQRFIRKIVVR
jgi:hypothetical protein